LKVFLLKRLKQNYAAIGIEARGQMVQRIILTYIIKGLSALKYCIINADDFGASQGINRGVIEAHCKGILTSTSLMVNMPASEDAIKLSLAVPNLSIGLHVNFTNEIGPPIVDLNSPDDCRLELERQVDRFQSLTGQFPTHLDSHHNIHRSDRLLPLFRDFTKHHNLPLRGYSAVRYFSSFYGKWDGESHPEQISSEKLIQMLTHDISEGVTELSCHPGYVEADFQSPYADEREIELRTLCDPDIKKKLDELKIVLVNYRALDRISRKYLF
jgi:predicted glycoside hydrolase/deacetylase ChbG (UPF0249 family)